MKVSIVSVSILDVVLLVELPKGSWIYRYVINVPYLIYALL
jgi:hypothetical protein